MLQLRQRGRLHGLLFSLILAFGLVPQGAAGLEQRLITVSTGGRTGVYYFAGGAICSFLNALRWSTGVRCLAKSTFGSIENLNAVRSGRTTFGIVQSDWQYHAVTGSSVFEAAGPDTELRAIFALFPEPLTVVAGPDTDIDRFVDLAEKRVSLGPAGSGGRATMYAVMNALGWTESEFAYVADLPMDALSSAICSGEIDAAVFVVAHPNLTVDDMVNDCDARLVPLEGESIDAIVEKQPHYVETEIPAGTYAGQTAGVPAFAIRATMVASARTAPSLVEMLVESVFNNLDELRASHPAFEDLDPQSMVTEGLTAPLHIGARQFYEAQGFLSEPAPSQ